MFYSQLCLATPLPYESVQKGRKDGNRLFNIRVALMTRLVFPHGEILRAMFWSVSGVLVSVPLQICLCLHLHVKMYYIYK